MDLGKVVVCQSPAFNSTVREGMVGTITWVGDVDRARGVTVLFDEDVCERGGREVFFTTANNQKRGVPVGDGNALRLLEPCDDAACRTLAAL